MRIAIGILVTTVLAGTNGAAFFTNDWTDSLKQFLQQTQQSIEKKSDRFLTELGDSAQHFVERSKGVFSTVAQNLKSGGQKLKATVMETAETTLRGAGDEVEGFFSEVPNRVNNGFEEILAKLAEACSWVFKNIIAPILFIIILLGLAYIFVVSGCCGCCCSTLLAQFNSSLGNAFKRIKKDENLQNNDGSVGGGGGGNRIILLRDLEASIPLQQAELNSELLKNARILRI